MNRAEAINEAFRRINPPFGKPVTIVWKESGGYTVEEGNYPQKGEGSKFAYRPEAQHEIRLWLDEVGEASILWNNAYAYYRVWSEPGR